MSNYTINRNIAVIKKMTSRYTQYLASENRGGDWELSTFLDNIHRRIENIEAELKKKS